MDARIPVGARLPGWMVHGAFGALLAVAVTAAAGERALALTAGGLLLGGLYMVGAAGGRLPGRPGMAWVWLIVLTVGWGGLALASAWFAGLALPLAFAWLWLLPLWGAVFGVSVLTCLSLVVVAWHAGEVSVPVLLGLVAVAAVVTLAGLRQAGRYAGDGPYRECPDGVPNPPAGSADLAAGGLPRHAAPDGSAGGAGPGRPGTASGVVAVRRSSLIAAVRRLSEATASRASIPVRFGVAGTPVELPPSHDTALLRVARGALGNVGRHSEAGYAGVTLTYLADLIMLDVFDDGRGFDPYTTPGYDLRGMRRQVEALGGTLSVESAPGGGTTVVAGLPKQPPIRPEQPAGPVRG